MRASVLPALGLVLFAVVVAPKAAGAAAGATKGATAEARPWIGIGIEKGTTGVRVTSIVPDTPAAHAGLLVGDEVLSVDGTDVAEPAALIARVRERGVGAKVELALAREAQRLVVPLTLVARPDELDLLRQRLLAKPAPRLVVRTVTPPPAVTGKGKRRERPRVELAQLAGQVVVLEFFATWCGPCRASMPVLSSWQKEHGSRGLRVLGVSSEAAEVLARFAAAERPGYTVAVAESGVEDFFVPAVPTLVVVDRRGVVRHVEVGGGVALERIEATFRALLEE